MGGVPFGPPSTGACGSIWRGHWSNRALEQQNRLTDLVGDRQIIVKTTALEEAIEGWSSSALRRAQSSRSGTILAYESGLSLSRSSPMPTLSSGTVATGVREPGFTRSLR